MSPKSELTFFYLRLKAVPVYTGPRNGRALAMALLLFLALFSIAGSFQVVNASNSTVNSQWCSGAGGTWDAGTSTCTNPICGHPPATIAKGDNLTIPAGTTVSQTNDCWITVNGALLNYGTLNLQSGSLLNVNGSFENFGVVLQTGTIDNFLAGVLTNEPSGKVRMLITANDISGITNQGLITNRGLIDICGNVLNEGAIHNYFNITIDNCKVQGQPGGNFNNAYGAAATFVEECGGFLVQVTGSTYEAGTTTTVTCSTTTASTSRSFSSSFVGPPPVTSTTTTAVTTQASQTTTGAPPGLPVSTLEIIAVLIGLGVIAGLGWFLRGRMVGRGSRPPAPA